MDSNTDILLVGAGPMAVEYGKVLKARNAKFAVVGRGAESAAKFAEKTGVQPFVGGLETFLQNNPPAKFAVVAVNVKNLCLAAMELVKHGTEKVLVEKPCALNLDDLNKLQTEADKKRSEIFIGYNRRFCSSVIKAQEIIAGDGGLTSFHFEFTELGYRVDATTHPPEVKSKWFIVNSTHVADLAFYVGGMPSKILSTVSGAMSWHPSGAFFAGHGETEKKVPFSYRADWNAPGRWSVELCTKEHRIILKPLEELKIQKRGSVAIEDVVIDDKLDKEYKPGLYRQMEEFLSSSPRQVPMLEHQIQMMKFYNQIGGYR